jgi:hypothetical protein
MIVTALVHFSFVTHQHLSLFIRILIIFCQKTQSSKRRPKAHLVTVSGSRSHVVGRLCATLGPEALKAFFLSLLIFPNSSGGKKRRLYAQNDYPMLCDWVLILYLAGQQGCYRGPMVMEIRGSGDSVQRKEH